MDLVKQVKDFFKIHLKDNRPILLGYSGGTDSSVLFELLLEAKIPFIAVHIDHSWRQTSADEAEMLKKRACSLGVPFYSIRLDLQNEKGNLEEICRLKRYAYFKKLCEELNASAVCVGHHRDDRNETTLTRLLQGYSLHHLNGMNSEGVIEGVKVLRPLLDISKNQLMKYPLKYPPIQDCTNYDEKFLRARLRALKEGLGKEIEAPLARISNESEELRQFLSIHLKPILQTVKPICCGSWLDLSERTLCRFEMRFLIREFLRQQRVIFSHHLVESALCALETGKANHTVQGNDAKLIVDRKHLFLVNKIPEFRFVDDLGPAKLGWQHFLLGELTVALPEGAKLIPCGKHASHLWNNCHVPAFLRQWAPMLQTADGKIIELLSGRSHVDGTKFIRQVDRTLVL